MTDNGYFIIECILWTIIGIIVIAVLSSIIVKVIEHYYGKRNSTFATKHIEDALRRKTDAQCKLKK